MYELEKKRPTATEDDRPEPLADAAHFVLFHRELSDGAAGVVYEPGDELPADLAARVWSAFNDRIAAYDEYGRRVDTPAESETDMDTTGLQEWGREASMTPPAESHVCATCNQVFPTEAALHGHQSKHAEDLPDPETPNEDAAVPTAGDSDAAGADATDEAGLGDMADVSEVEDA